MKSEIKRMHKSDFIIDDLEIGEIRMSSFMKNVYEDPDDEDIITGMVEMVRFDAYSITEECYFTVFTEKLELFPFFTMIDRLKYDFKLAEGES